jgi:hypothetical protein
VFCVWSARRARIGRDTLTNDGLSVQTVLLAHEGVRAYSAPYRKCRAQASRLTAPVLAYHVRSTRSRDKPLNFQTERDYSLADEAGWSIALAGSGAPARATAT